MVTLSENESYKLIQGKVFDVNGEALEGVLVEVFDKPDWIKDNKYPPPDDQKRIHACFSDKNGKFCFPKIAKGNYEVLFSKDSRFNPTYLFLRVNPNSSKGRKKLIGLYLTLGT